MQRYQINIWILFIAIKLRIVLVHGSPSSNLRSINFTFNLMSCPAENIFEKMESHLKNLSDGVTLSKAEDRVLRNLLDEYWTTTCPIDQPPCNRDICNLARTNDWISYLGYSCAGELLHHFKYEGVKDLCIKELAGPPTPWLARRAGHFNP